MTAVTAHFGSEALEVQVLSVSCVCACTMCLRTCARLKFFFFIAKLIGFVKLESSGAALGEEQQLKKLSRLKVTSSKIKLSQTTEVPLIPLCSD